MAVSTSPAMLNFLNNQQNSKEHPNENLRVNSWSFSQWEGKLYRT
ncbi:DUF1800 family protein [Sphingobacterium multivorum]